MYKLHKTKKSSKLKNRKLVVLGGLMLACLLVLGILELTNTTHLLHKQKAVSGTIPTTSNGDSDQDQSETSSNQSDGTATPAPTPVVDTPKSTTPTGTNSDLIAPYGTFVSNHAPSLSNRPDAPSSEQSVCLTTPGASCAITFTMGGVTKTLSAQTADNKGAVYWNWDVKQAGLTEGDWTITATATSNGQSKSTKDNLVLRVSS